jgi:hypothetical protein
VLQRQHDSDGGGEVLEVARSKLLVVGQARIASVGGVMPEQGAQGKDLGGEIPPDTWARQREGEADGWTTTAPRAHVAEMRREAPGPGWVRKRVGCESSPIRKGKGILNFRIRFSNNTE